MGATNFENTISAKTAGDGYFELCAKAVHDHGHSSYNGTISTTTGFVTLTPKAGETRDQMIDRCLEDERTGVSKFGAGRVYRHRRGPREAGKQGLHLLRVGG